MWRSFINVLVSVSKFWSSTVESNDQLCSLQNVCWAPSEFISWCHIKVSPYKWNKSYLRRVEPQTWDASAAVTAGKQMPISLMSMSDPWFICLLKIQIEICGIRTRPSLIHIPNLKAQTIFPTFPSGSTVTAIFLVMVVECIQLWTHFLKRSF